MHPVSLASFARAKIQTPRFRSSLIERSELEQQLGSALADHRLVLLVAPAGYGKTAALSRQLERLPAGYDVAWVTADEEDDLPRLLSHLIEALEPLDPPWRLAREAFLEQVAQGRLREMAMTLAGTLEATGVTRGLIVLDDLHAVADVRVFEFLDHVLEGLPQNWTLVIAARVEPPLALWRWRARREIAEFDEAALGFSRTEVQDLWRLATGRDDPEQALRLLDRTQGWPAGLCLSLQSFKASAAPLVLKGTWHNRRHLFDYLATEVFEDLPDELQDFLLHCALLPELTAPRCERVSGNPRAAELLEEIERRRLFVTVLDSDTLTLRLHELFRDFLEERLRRLHPQKMPTLLRQAARDEADPIRQTLLLLRVGAWEEAQQCLAEAAPALLDLDEESQVIRLIEQFPADIRAVSPFLAYARGLCAWPHYQYGTARSAMAQAAAGFDAAGRQDEAQRARAMQALGMFFCGQMVESLRLSQEVRARPMDLETEALSELLDFWYEGHHGPVDGPGEHLGKLVDLLTRRGSAELWLRCIPRVYMFISRPGVSPQLQRLVDRARTAAGDGHWSLQATVNVMEGWLLLWRCRLQELKATFQKIEEDARWLGQPEALRTQLLGLKVNYQVACDDRDAACATGDLIAAQAALLDQAGDQPLTFLSIVVRASAAIGDWAAVRMRLPSLDFKARENPRLRMFIRTLHAQLALREGRLDEALAELRDLAQTSALLDSNCLDATVRTRLALAELAGGSPAAAWRALAPLIERVQASGDVGQVLITGVQSLSELSLAAWGHAAPGEGLDVLRRWVETARSFKTAVQSLPRAAEAHHEGLSERELEVLALLAQGLSNKLIARALDLSPHTVKRHVARILDRLDLDSRMQAAAWYHARVGS
ncbi:hypothetical protein GCM10023165_19240 [Variovorax defluvii]|uniref:HTH luxR-type domain-containing protein n=1 Tax=Variovorax defluvii TaxID=913761 RepID=A0ABP8HIJ9_9BURK